MLLLASTLCWELGHTKCTLEYMLVGLVVVFYGCSYADDNDDDDDYDDYDDYDYVHDDDDNDYDDGDYHYVYSSCNCNFDQESLPVVYIIDRNLSLGSNNYDLKENALKETQW